MESWEILVDIIGLCICSTTILYLVITRAKKICNRLLGEDRDNFINFDDEMISQLIKQQSEEAFESISHILKKEQISLFSHNPFQSYNQQKKHMQENPKYTLLLALRLHQYLIYAVQKKLMGPGLINRFERSRLSRWLALVAAGAIADSCRSDAV